MKKPLIAGLALLLPVAILCGCTGKVNVTINANWYRNTALSDSISDTHEKLEYKVTFQAPQKETNFSLKYDEGSYVTELTSETYRFEDGFTELVYVYRTSLNITGRYTLGGVTGETFTDSVETETVFRNAKLQLQPIKSQKTVHTTSPIALPYTEATDLSQVTKVYHYTATATYANDLSSMKYSYRDLTAEKEEEALTEREYQLNTNVTYLDNDQLLFALRGINLATEVTLSSFNPVKGEIEKVVAGNSVSTTVELTDVKIGEKEPAPLKADAYSVSFGYSSTTSGPSQKLYYAKTIENDNVYRNALLSMEVPLYYDMGTLVYNLSSATFTTK